MFVSDNLPSSVEKIRAFSTQEYEMLIDNLSSVIEKLKRLDLWYQAFQVQAVRDHIVERRMGIKP